MSVLKVFLGWKDLKLQYRKSGFQNIRLLVSKQKEIKDVLVIISLCLFNYFASFVRNYFMLSSVSTTDSTIDLPPSATLPIKEKSHGLFAATYPLADTGSVRVLVPIWRWAYKQLIDSLAVWMWVDALPEYRGAGREERYITYCRKVGGCGWIVKDQIVNSATQTRIWGKDTT